MNWKHVQLIFQREMSDQLRDRRTLFTITILPILLYPLIGLLMMQVAQFNRESPVTVRIVGAENWPERIPLLDESGQLAIQNENELKSLIEIDSRPWPTNQTTEQVVESARETLEDNQLDAVLIVGPEFEQELQSRINPIGEVNSVEESSEAEIADDSEKFSPTEVSNSNDSQGLTFVANLARDHSQIAQRRMSKILEVWGGSWARIHLKDEGIDPAILQRVQPREIDVAPVSIRQAVMWSKILPFVMLVWALTGAFYPAIDLCAGEKERGTLETLLSSPARRREIVWGKLGAVSVFSISSALLNLLSMHFTAGFIVKQLSAQGGPQLAEALGPLPFHALGWLILLLLPMAAFFSALALAVAALARSTKEGQYYLMPLLLVTLPLVALPMLPSLDLNIGTSLVPVSGAIFLVRALIEGEYAQAAIHVPFVLIVTAGCCWISIRWAIKQFESESVMFRESERWNLRLWVNHLWRDREETASPSEAILCGVTVLVCMFFAQFMAGSSVGGWGSIVKSTVIVQLGIILTPCLLMSIFLTRSIRQALRLNAASPSQVIATALLGVCLHPSYLILGNAIAEIYTISESMKVVLGEFQGMVMSQPIWAVLLVMAVLPAICEELTFRGFIFGGLQRQGVFRAIIISALFFGFTHMVLQQSIAASMMGLLLGFIAWRTGGVLCTIVFHLINNTLSITLAWCAANSVSMPSMIRWALDENEGAWEYNPSWVAMSMMLSIALFFVIVRGSGSEEPQPQAELI